MRIKNKMHDDCGREGKESEVHLMISASICISDLVEASGTSPPLDHIIDAVS